MTSTIEHDFHSVSVHDLLDAREAYHVHLTRMKNVVSTAIGRYRIRFEDLDKDGRPIWRKRGSDTPRTLARSRVVKESWPCVLVFVKKWIKVAQFGEMIDDIVPQFLYLSDGRVVPTCVVLSPRVPGTRVETTAVRFSAGLLGGGFPVLTELQGEQRVGSFGCLVTDGESIFALTNQHVAGDEGTPVFTVVNGERHPVGLSHRKQARKLLFPEAYPGFPGLRTYSNVDAGLIKVTDVKEWTSQVFGIGEIGEPFDFNADTASLDLVGRQTRAFGGVSGTLEGEIQALFYRYRSLGGSDYVADFLIGPRWGKTLATRPGDSGTLWFLESDAAGDAKPEKRRGRKPARGAEPTPCLEPIALQWGGERLGEEAAPLQFALGSGLSTICRVLDLSVIRDLNTGHSEYWGKVGHFKIGISACSAVKNADLRQLMTANAERVSVSDADIKAGLLPKDNQAAFIALADVPDLVWRHTRGRDKANHFADVDQKGIGGKTLQQHWTTASKRTPRFWTTFFDDLEQSQGQNIPDRQRGALPFRVAEIFDEMVSFVEAEDADSFVCAAGVLAHYVGDGAQPLHGSHLHDGRTPDEAGIHSAYETNMLDSRRAELIDLVNDRLDDADPAVSLVNVVSAGTIKTGKAAANAIMKLIKAAQTALPPVTIIETWLARGRKPTRMWDEDENLRNKTATCLILGIRFLAAIWEGAWMKGKGDDRDIALGAVPTDRLQALYIADAFLESTWMKDM